MNPAKMTAIAASSYNRKKKDTSSSSNSGGAGVSGGRIRVGKYELGRTLGEGSFAKVKYARNKESGEAVAIKIIDKERIIKHRMVHQIKREISTMKLIKHPHVVQLLEVLASKKKVYLVMEYVNGGELFDKIVCAGRLNEKEARKYFQQLVQAIDYCHSRGVYHRDLKPENLLLDSNGRLKISDFGLSAFSQQCLDDGLLHTTCGTPNYVAPEVINKRGYDGAPADLWSCGIILYVLLAGFLPFEDSNLMRLYKKIDHAELAFPPWFSSGPRRLIRKILDPNPKTRMTVAQVLSNDWFRIGYRSVKCIDKDKSMEGVDSSTEDIPSGTEEARPVLMNAFKLISMSPGLNLSGLFEEKKACTPRTENRFASMHPAKEIIAKISDFAKSVGYTLTRKNNKMKMQNTKPGRKGFLSVATEIFEVSPSLCIVEMRKSNGDTLEYGDFHKNLSVGLKDIVWTTAEELETEGSGIVELEESVVLQSDS